MDMQYSCHVKFKVGIVANVGGDPCVGPSFSIGGTLNIKRKSVDR